MHQEIPVLITNGQSETTETELMKWMLYKTMDDINNVHPTPLTPWPCQKCIKFIHVALNNSILWNMKIIFTKYLLQKKILSILRKLALNVKHHNPGTTICQGVFTKCHMFIQYQDQWCKSLWLTDHLQQLITADAIIHFSLGDRDVIFDIT